MTPATWSVAASAATIIGVAITYLAFRKGRSPSNLAHAAATGAAFAEVRSYLEHERPSLTAAAANGWSTRWAAPASLRYLSTAFYTVQEWIPIHPLPIARINVSFEPTDLVSWSRSPFWPKQSLLPSTARGVRHERYSEAYETVCHPTPEQFHDGLSYRLTGCDLRGSHPALRFGLARFSDFFDICEGQAHQFAERRIGHAGRSRHASHELVGRLRQVSGNLASRAADPFNLAQRPVPLGISTLTLRRTGAGVTFYLHDRSLTHVASAGGMIHLLPAGLFQPGSRSSPDLKRDCSLVRNIAREYGEELLSVEEARGETAVSTDWLTEGPLAGFAASLDEGRLRIWCLGMGLDPLTLWCDMMTVAVFDDELFCRWFPTLKPNYEGTVAGVAKGDQVMGHPFTESSVSAFLDDRRIAPVAAACLKSAWEQRHQLIF